MRSQVTCRGLLLRSYDYSDTSRIFRFLTPDHGVLSVIAKGIRGRTARGEAPIRTFGEGWLTFVHQSGRDLHSMRDFQADSSSGRLDPLRLAATGIMAELLLAHTPEGRDAPLYDWASQVFRSVGTAHAEQVPGWALAGGWRLMAHFGYPPETAHCVSCGGDLAPEPKNVPVDAVAEPGPSAAGLDRFDTAAGGLRCASCGEGTSLPRIGPGARSDLRAFVSGASPSGLRGAAQHLALLEAFALHHLSPRSEFKSFSLFRDLLNTPGAASYS